MMMKGKQLFKLDDRQIDARPDELRLFAGVKNELQKLPYFLKHHRKIGIDRFFFIDNESTDGTVEYLKDQPDCHCFHASGSHFAENVTPPNWTNALLNTFGDHHWCLTIDVDELFVYPRYESLGLRDFCKFLDSMNAEVVFALMIDMYPKGAIESCRYERGKPFLDFCSYFDPDPGRKKEIGQVGYFPPIQVLGGVRERAFWHGRFKKTLPPCISKVPLIRWRKGMRYISAQHLHSGARLSDIQAALLHFKFLAAFHQTTANSLKDNRDVAEKGLEERAAYIEMLQKNPEFSLYDERSVNFRNSAQLVGLGWMSESEAYRKYVRRFSKTQMPMYETIDRHKPN